IRNCIEIGVQSIEHCSLPDEESLDLMVEKNIYMVPTFASGELINQYGIEFGLSQETIDKSKRMADEKNEKYKLALNKGVKVAMGTDASTPFNYHGKNALELTLMVQAGMSEVDAIIASTKHAAEVCGIAREVGTIEEGKLADLLLV